MAFTTSKAAGKLSIVAARCGMGVLLCWVLVDRREYPFTRLTQNLLRYPLLSYGRYARGRDVKAIPPSGGKPLFSKGGTPPFRDIPVRVPIVEVSRGLRDGLGRVERRQPSRASRTIAGVDNSFPFSESLAKDAGIGRSRKSSHKRR